MLQFNEITIRKLGVYKEKSEKKSKNTDERSINFGVEKSWARQQTIEGGDFWKKREEVCQPAKDFEHLKRADREILKNIETIGSLLHLKEVFLT